MFIKVAPSYKVTVAQTDTDDRFSGFVGLVLQSQSREVV